MVAVCRVPEEAEVRGRLVAPGMDARLEVRVLYGALLEATVSQWQLHEAQGRAVRSKRRFHYREDVWDGSRRRTAAPNASEALCRPVQPGERAENRDARYSVEVGTVLGPGAAGHCASLPWEISSGPTLVGRSGGNDARPMPEEKADHLIVALKPGKAG